MKKRTALALALALVFALSLNAFSDAAQVQPYSRSFVPQLSFKGTTASCYVNVYSPGDEISVTLSLRYGGTHCGTWYGSGTSLVVIDKTKEVTAGYTYTLTVSGTINGESFGPTSVTAYCG